MPNFKAAFVSQTFDVLFGSLHGIKVGHKIYLSEILSAKPINIFYTKYYMCEWIFTLDKKVGEIDLYTDMFQIKIVVIFRL